MTLKRISRSALSALLALACVLVVAACGSSSSSSSSSTSGTATSAASSGGKITSNAKNKSVKLVIGSKNFTEQKVLGDIYAQALTAAGYSVTTQLNLGDEKTALAALKSNQISAYPEYTGTALLSFFGVKTDALPHDPGQAYDEVKTRFAKQGITAEPPTPFTSSNEVALNPGEAKKLGVTKISDLKGKAPKLKLYGTPECRQRLDCLLGLEKVYGLHFKSFTPVDPQLRHTVLEKHQADVSIVFTTDPQNKRDHLVLLKDDKHMFPPYNSTLLVKTATAKKAGPDFAKTVDLVSKGLTAPVMQELNGRVDLDKQTPEAVAKEYLKESGYIG